MNLRHLAFLLAGAGAAILTYGALWEANRLVVERRTLRLRNWRRSMSGYKIALLADMHLRDRYTLDLARRAVAAALDEAPDMVVLGGDLVAYWKETSAQMLGDVLEPLLLMNGNVVAVPGNHEYWSGTPDLMVPIFDELNIKLLRNETWFKDGINWIGIDSRSAFMDDPRAAVKGVQDGPRIVLWHEPDPVDELPFDADLQLSGHSHGGQFTFPGGYTPMHTDNGRKYVRGYYPEAKVPIYVSRGLGTTGPPSRFNCAPEVSILTLEPVG